MSATITKQSRTVHRYVIDLFCDGAGYHVGIESECYLNLNDQFSLAHEVLKKTIYFNDIDCYYWMFDFTHEVFENKYWVSATDIVLDKDTVCYYLQVWDDTTEGTEK